MSGRVRASGAFAPARLSGGTAAPGLGVRVPERSASSPDGQLPRRSRLRQPGGDTDSSSRPSLLFFYYLKKSVIFPFCVILNSQIVVPLG